MRRGFTLIETMIAMSLMAILLAGHIEFFRELNAVQRQQDFLRAARQAERQLLELDKVPFELLPPQLLKPDSEGWLQLAQKDVEPASLRLERLEGEPASLPLRSVEARSGRVRVAPELAGQMLMVNYAYFACDSGETLRVGQDGQVQLSNQPIVRVERVLLAHGEQLSPCRDWRFAPETGLQLGPSARGRVAVVDYRGQTLANQVQGEFLSRDLRRQSTPSNIKLLTLSETFLGKQRFTITSLRMAER